MSKETILENYVVPNKPIYPVINSKRLSDTLTLETYLRKKHKGKYYLWKFQRNAYVPEGRTDLSSAFSSFNRDIYLAQLHGKIDVKKKYGSGKLFFELDPNQMDEKLRMKPIS